MIDKSKVFISYSRQDTKVTTALARDLHAAGIKIWMDREDIAVGERWSTAVQSALEEAYAMVLVISPDSMASPNVEDEFTYYLDNHKPLVPVVVRPTKLHFQLHRLQWVDFTQGDREKAYEDLIRALYAVGVEFDTDSATEHGTQSVIAGLLDEIDSEKRQSMRKRRIMGGVAAVLAIVILVGIGLLAFGGGDPEPTPKPTLEFVTGRVDGPDVVMYDQPSRDSLIVVENIPDGTPLIVRQYTPDERFLLVEFGTNRGFVLTRDVIVADITEIGVFLSPTPLPTATATEFITPTPTVTPSPTPEVVMNPSAQACIVTVSTEAQAQPALLGPSSVRFAAFDTVKPSESFLATARFGETWFYIGIGWVELGAGVSVNDLTYCLTLPEDENLGPNRIRPFIKELPVVDELQPRITIPTDDLPFDSLLVAEAWNAYGGLLENLSELLTVDDELLLTVIVDEASDSGGGEAPNLLNVRFEANLFDSFLPKEQQIDFDSNFWVDPADRTHHMFRLEKGDEFMEFHGNATLEWQAFDIARQLNPEAAIRALRFGANGLLGDHHALIGYVTPQDMFNAYMSSQSARVIGKLDFIKSHIQMLGALRFQNWGRFEELYAEYTGVPVGTSPQTYYDMFMSLQ